MRPSQRSVVVGTAGWQIPRAVADAFCAEGSTLARYAGRFAGVEINSTFYRSHRTATFERWVAATPDDFRFAVKLPKAVTHERRLVDASDLVERFLAEIQPLAPKLGPVLVQLPPSFAFDADVATPFFASLRERIAGFIACEPRHPSWFEAEPDQLLAQLQVARVAADPARVPQAARPGGWPGLRYWRLHGSPRMYWSAYSPEQIAALAADIAGADAPCWCIFDNTTSGAAAVDALALKGALTSACAEAGDP